MGASRYIAVDSVEYQRRGERATVKPGDLVAGNHPAVAVNPDAFLTADGPVGEARVRAQKALAERRNTEDTKPKTSKARASGRDSAEHKRDD